MAEITMKSTKAEIMEAYKAAVEKLDTRDRMIDDPAKEAAKAKKVEVIESADKTAKEDIFNPEIIKKYNDLTEAIEIKQLELDELYGIETKANAMAAMINAYKEKNEELKEAQAAKEAEIEAELGEKKDTLKAEIEALKQQKQEIIDSVNAEAKARENEIKLTRSREEDEYTYNLKRSRKAENDKWEDEKAAREKILELRETAALEKETELNAKADHVKELEAKVEEIPTLIAAATEEGIKKGKADADKSNGFEVRALKKDAEYQKQLLEDKNERLTEDLANARAEKVELQQKLDDAYAQMRELAAKTVESTGGVKILNGQTQQNNNDNLIIRYA